MAEMTLDSGWTTVHRQFQGNPERMTPAQRETFERTRIKEWEASDGHWSGIGKHPSDHSESKLVHDRIAAPKDNSLGLGAHGRVEKVTYRAVCLARKWIQPRRNQKTEILRSEAHVMDRLDHDHIVKLVGSYALRHRELYLLIWPVAVCNLSDFLVDLEDLKIGHQTHREEIVRRLESLGLTDLTTVESGGRQQASPERCPIIFLQRIIGCISQAVTYCHRSNIRHLDIKPTNILLNPDRVYLADFGISRDVNDQEKTTTVGNQGTPKWRAPETYGMKDWSMKSADIYSLGLIFINAATAIYHGNLSSYYAILEDTGPQSRAGKLHSYHQQLTIHARATQKFQDFKAPTVAPRHILDLTRRMTLLDPGSRPRAEQVDQELVDLGGIEQVYHNACCRKNMLHVSKRIDRRYAALQSERLALGLENDSLRKEISALKGMDETFRMREESMKNKHAMDVEILEKQRDKERVERIRLDESLKTLQSQMKRQSRTRLPRADTISETRTVASDTAPGVLGGLGIQTRPQTHPATQTAFRPPPSTTLPTPTSIRRQTAVAPTPSDPQRAWVTRNAAVMAGFVDSGPALRCASSPSLIPLPSRGSGTRLPILAKTPATPRRSNPNLTAQSSSAESTIASMTSSVFSHLSLETNAEASPSPKTPSPAVKQGGFDVVPTASEVAPPREPQSPVLSIPPSLPSITSSPRMTRAELASGAGSEYSRDGSVARKPPSLSSGKSWAAVAGGPNELGEMFAARERQTTKSGSGPASRLHKK
ncbi:Sperm motility kinase [Colletotrichum sidae]|uniref:non-specific serine/threonine protein kinase n=1 Tax=Colletotrichum sidae TaxID=1347389 RepID=A0A4R8TLG2_9PEZI|nr:Sperm motility kinase [Colletotrichum sidae]